MVMSDRDKKQCCDTHSLFVQPAFRERDDLYNRVIVKPKDRWRIILCRHALQFILQKRSTKTPNAGVWVGKSYCTTRDSLIDVCSHLGLLSDANTEAVLHALPDRARDYRRN
jgi:hypothetical protein